MPGVFGVMAADEELTATVTWSARASPLFLISTRTGMSSPGLTPSGTVFSTVSPGFLRRASWVLTLTGMDLLTLGPSVTTTQIYTLVTIEHLREGTRLDPLAFRLHFHLGLLYGKQARVYDAIQELITALDINGRHFPALKNLAVLYERVGFRWCAADTWERALSVAPDESTRAQIKDHLGLVAPTHRT